MKKTEKVRVPHPASLENVKGGFVIVEDDVVLRESDDGESIVIEDEIIFREAP